MLRFTWDIFISCLSPSSRLLSPRLINSTLPSIVDTSPLKMSTFAGEELQDLKTLGISESELDMINDSLTTQPPIMNSTTPSVKKDLSGSWALLGELKNYWRQLEDPHSRILKILEKLCVFTQDTRQGYV